MFLRLVLGVFAALVLVGMAAAEVPQLIDYQGSLYSGGSPVTTPTSVVFAIWDDPTTGDSLWSEQKMITPNADGLFSTLLGSASLIPDSAFIENAYLSVKVESDPEMSPRQQIVSVGYAYRVGTVDGASGGTITGEIAVTEKANIGFSNSNSGQYAFVVGRNSNATGAYSSIGGVFSIRPMATMPQWAVDGFVRPITRRPPWPVAGSTRPAAGTRLFLAAPRMLSEATTRLF